MIRWLARPEFPQSPAHAFRDLEPLCVCGNAALRECAKPKQTRRRCAHCVAALAPVGTPKPDTSPARAALDQRFEDWWINAGSHVSAASPRKGLAYVAFCAGTRVRRA